jgi:hypothetical protein
MRLLGSGTEVVVVEDSNPRTVNDVFQDLLVSAAQGGSGLAYATVHSSYSIMSAYAVLPSEPTASMAIYRIPDAPYKLKKPLLIEIERDESGAYVVSEPATGVFHYNLDFGAAVTEFLRVLVDEFEFLQKNQSTLSPALGAELERFRQYLEPA